MSKIFLISPVTLNTPEIESQVRDYINILGLDGHEVYYPLDHTFQNMPVELIFMQNRRAMERADEVHVYYVRSYGISFDLGMAFAMGKPITLANAFEVFERLKPNVKSMENFVATFCTERGGWI